MTNALGIRPTIGGDIVTVDWRTYWTYCMAVYLSAVTAALSAFGKWSLANDKTLKALAVYTVASMVIGTILYEVSLIFI